MNNNKTTSLLVFIIACTLLILLLITFITIIIYKYQQKQNAYFQNLQELEAIHLNDMLQSKLEIQEQTFANISREIHDNIGQKLTLAKLHLNIINACDNDTVTEQIENAVLIIGQAISDLSDLSRSMSSDIIINNGFIKALEFEVNQLNKPGIYTIRLLVIGETIFLAAEKELILFRIIQEALNNIVKHAEATEILLELHYNDALLELTITDNGKGFLMGKNNPGNGLANMSRRAKMLNGMCEITSEKAIGTIIKLKIPLNDDYKTL